VAGQTNNQFIGVEPELSITEVFGLIDLAAKNLRRIQRLAVRESGLTPPQYHLLLTLWDNDGIPFKDLADLEKRRQR
jgi:hypothetical protein